MANHIEVRVDGRGIVTGHEAREDGSVSALCATCGDRSEAVVSIGTGASASFVCAGCLRERLDALSVARWRMKESRGPSASIPWGKASG